MRRLWRIRRAIIRGESREENQVCGEGPSMTEEIPEDPSRRRCHHGNPLYQSSCATYTSSSCPRILPWILPFVCADVYATCTRYVAHRKLHLQRYTGNSLEREIFEVANLFSRLILQRTSFAWYVVALQDDEVLTRLKGISHTVVQLFLSSLSKR